MANSAYQIPGIGQSQAASMLPPPSNIAPLDSSAMPILASPALPNVIGPGPSPLTMATAKRDQMAASGSGIAQIRNPILRGIASAADIAGSVFAPRLEGLIPGTQGHHDLLMHQQDGLIAQDQAQQAADTAQQTAQAELRQHQAAATLGEAQVSDLSKPAAPKYTYVDTPDGKAAIAEGTTTAVPVTENGQPLQGKGPDPHYVTTNDGNVVSIAPGPDGQPHATTVYQGTPKQNTEITKLEIGGQPHTVIVDKDTGATVKDLGETGEKPPSMSVSTGTFSLAQMPDGNGGMKSVLLNNKTGQVQDAAPGLTKGSPTTQGPTIADKNRASLAKVAMANLDKIADIMQRRGNDLVGPGQGRVANVDQMIGSNDPDLVALVNEAHNFSMANAGVHGSRSVQNVRDAVHDLFGDLHNGPQGIMGGVNANRANLRAIINSGSASGSAGNTGTPSGGSGGHFSVTAPNGRQYSFKDQQSLESFKAKAGIK